jgi:hypothetical protein
MSQKNRLVAQTAEQDQNSDKRQLLGTDTYSEEKEQEVTKWFPHTFYKHPVNKIKKIFL